ncbi:phage tail protein [Clostridium tyrobutyricum]|uniref:phage tail protein n=1 Tax=Clostridium tyrobutyricum TaxID=1519 RepID=UPI001C39009C|nr:phage tail protein [Clostridium tyrobutyricum]MBV4427192.1 phage tail protein [Clostridium tyrobutyricum]MBV4442473.1 phage tail protein [Clostridium tyrobutyricum]
MAETFYTILTNIGKAKIANAAALGTDINITKFAVGDGNGSYYNPTEDQITLKNEVWHGNTTSVNVDPDNPNWIVAGSIITATDGGFMIREAAIFDADDDMIAIGKYPETYKPLVTEGSAKDLNVKMIIEVSNASSVTLKINPSVLFATKTDLNNLAGAGRTTETVKGNADDIEAYKQDYEYQTPTISNTQIQLVKHSDTNILKFKLDYDLSGNITISTDAGATEKPLVDTDGTQITDLEKGFVEVVADADFFTLRNKGGLSLSDKQNLIDIANEAEANNSTTRENLINTINNVLNANLSSSTTWNEINNYLTENGINFIPDNIKQNINIFGKTGILPTIDLPVSAGNYGIFSDSVMKSAGAEYIQIKEYTSKINGTITITVHATSTSSGTVDIYRNNQKVKNYSVGQSLSQQSVDISISEGDKIQIDAQSSVSGAIIYIYNVSISISQINPYFS